MTHKYRDKEVEELTLKEAREEVTDLRGSLKYVNKMNFRLGLKEEAVALIEGLLAISIVSGLFVGTILTTESCQTRNITRHERQVAEEERIRTEQLVQEARIERRQTELVKEVECRVITEMNELLELRDLNGL